jgi:hypothetical protein
VPTSAPTERAGATVDRGLKRLPQSHRLGSAQAAKREERRANMRIAVVREARAGLHDKIVIRVITTALDIFVIPWLKVHYQRTTGARPQVRAAAVERLAVMEAYLASFQLYRDQGGVSFRQDRVDNRERGALPFDFQLVRPPVTPVDHRHRTVRSAHVSKRDPRGEHVLARARLPVVPVRMPSHIPRASLGAWRLVEQLVVPQPKTGRSRQASRTGRDERVPS